MKIEIDEEIIKKATKCTKGFDCINNCRPQMCQITSSVNNFVYFLNGHHDSDCPYCRAFGFQFICSCPVRNKIYDKYKI